MYQTKTMEKGDNIQIDKQLSKKADTYFITMTTRSLFTEFTKHKCSIAIHSW